MANLRDLLLQIFFTKETFKGYAINRLLKEIYLGLNGLLAPYYLHSFCVVLSEPLFIYVKNEYSIDFTSNGYTGP